MQHAQDQAERFGSKANKLPRFVQRGTPLRIQLLASSAVILHSDADKVALKCASA